MSRLLHNAHQLCTCTCIYMHVFKPGLPVPCSVLYIRMSCMLEWVSFLGIVYYRHVFLFPPSPSHIRPRPSTNGVGVHSSHRTQAYQRICRPQECRSHLLHELCTTTSMFVHAQITLLQLLYIDKSLCMHLCTVKLFLQKICINI